MNSLKTFVLMAALVALFMAAGYALAGRGGAGGALLIAGLMNVFAWWNSGKMVLRLHKGEELTETSAPELYAMTAQLARNAGLPMPKLYRLPARQPNAFATGRNPEHAAVAVSQGLLDTLTHEEVAGVVAHELAHIKNRDTLTMTIAASFAGALSMLGNMFMFRRYSYNRSNNGGNALLALVMIILAPLAAALIQMTISRTREYAADTMGAQICGQPLWLANALRKISRGAEATVNEAADQHPATAHMFIYNPLHLRQLGALFSTHPPVQERIARLEAMTAMPASSSTPLTISSTHKGPWGRRSL